MAKVKLDVKDKKILRIMTEEARTPPSAIAKAVGLSKGAVAYRIKQLEKKGIIFKYLVEIDPLLLGYDSYDIFLKFKMPPGGKNAVREYFNKHPNVCWSTSLSGEWNYFAELMCSSKEEFHELTKQMVATFQDVLQDYKFYIAGEIFRHAQMIDLISQGKSERFRPATRPGAETIHIDDAERKILTVMSENADMPVHK
ncbi:Lrp/AsnC family transcriptional regulator, partial [Candidatus Woesearchaeota archaeon]|nr:Lrp/AsnC family transcriptional regulator [Candidatus Woesearchaeota archaeon]